jgi:excisionase family DNA binding protein
MPEFYTPDELAALLRVTPQAIYNWIREGLITSVKIGRVRRIPATEVERLIREGTQPRRESGTT